MSTYNISDIQDFLSQIYGKNVTDPTTGQTRFMVPKMTVVPYGYNLTFLALAQNATQTAILTITANADFVLFGVNYRAQIGVVQNVQTKTAAFVRMLVTDSGTNEQFTASAVDLENYATNGGVDQTLFYPRFVAGKSSLTVQVTNYAPTAETYTSLDVFFEGVLCKQYG